MICSEHRKGSICKEYMKQEMRLENSLNVKNCKKLSCRKSSSNSKLECYHTKWTVKWIMLILLRNSSLIRIESHTRSTRVSQLLTRICLDKSLIKSTWLRILNSSSKVRINLVSLQINHNRLPSRVRAYNHRQIMYKCRRLFISPC